MGSVLRDHGTAKTVVHPNGSDVHVLTDIVAARGCNGRCREHNIGAAHEQVVVFDGSGPVRRKADFNSRAHGATPTGVARLIEDRREAVITDLNFNDLRGTAVTMLSEAGNTVQQVASVKS
jgi:hypothetical protein